MRKIYRDNNYPLGTFWQSDLSAIFIEVVPIKNLDEFFGQEIKEINFPKFF